MKALRYAEWSPFGWQGINLEVPSEWNPGKVGGDAKSGDIRLDDATTIRLELEWKEARGDDRVALIVDRYVEGLAKNAQKQKTRLQVERNAEHSWLDLPDMRPVEYFVWESGNRVHTLACYSPASDRLIFLRVMARPQESLKEALPRLLNSVRDTPPDAPQTWALYDLVCISPPGYKLETYDLKSGHIRLRFEEGRNILQIDRLSLARVLLKDRALQDWYQDFFRKDLRHIAYEAEESGVDGHPGLIVRGRPKSRWKSLLAPLPFWSARPRLHLDGRVWACDASNKIYAIQAFYKRVAQAPDIEACRRGVVCHSDAVQDPA